MQVRIAHCFALQMAQSFAISHCMAIGRKTLLRKGSYLQQDVCLADGSGMASEIEDILFTVASSNTEDIMRPKDTASTNADCKED